MKLTPLADRVLLKAVEAMETTASGIILSTATKEKPVISQVISVGPGGLVDGVCFLAAKTLSGVPLYDDENIFTTSASQ